MPDKYQFMASAVLLVSPDTFNFNEETSVSNKFQRKIPAQNIREKALEEFKNVVNELKKRRIEVITFPSPKNTNCPDAVFPNNWFSTHSDGKLFLYPMCTPNRRGERNPKIIDFLKKNYHVTELIDLSVNENDNRFLEGTGSLVFDHQDRKVYACISPRTNEKLINEVARILNYTPIVFEAFDKNGEPIYHTNVMMAVGEKFAIVCEESIENILERNVVKEYLLQSGKKIISISYAQMGSFAGNMLEVENNEEKKYLIMSKTALNSLNYQQRQEITEFDEILALDIDTIETVGGGSTRCMMAEILFEKIP